MSFVNGRYRRVFYLGRHHATGLKKFAFELVDHSAPGMLQSSRAGALP
jgi:hypothetical protein